MLDVDVWRCKPTLWNYCRSIACALLPVKVLDSKAVMRVLSLWNDGSIVSEFIHHIRKSGGWFVSIWLSGDFVHV